MPIFKQTTHPELTSMSGSNKIPKLFYGLAMGAGLAGGLALATAVKFSLELRVWLAPLANQLLLRSRADQGSRPIFRTFEEQYVLVAVWLVLTILVGLLYWSINAANGKTVSLKNKANQLAIVFTLVLLNVFVVAILVLCLPATPLPLLVGLVFGLLSGLLVAMLGSMIAKLRNKSLK